MQKIYIFLIYWIHDQWCFNDVFFFIYAYIGLSAAQVEIVKAGAVADVAGAVQQIVRTFNLRLVVLHRGKPQQGRQLLIGEVMMKMH